MNWPDEIEEAFLKAWRAGSPVLTVVEFQLPIWSGEVAALDDLARRCAGDDPLLDFLRRSAWSYAEAGRMLMAAGTPEFTARSINLYGLPDDIYPTQSFTGVDAAAFLLEKTDQLISSAYVTPTEACQPADQFAARLQQAVDAYFVDDRVEIVVDDRLSSKANGNNPHSHWRLALFTDLDFDQLYEPVL